MTSALLSFYGNTPENGMMALYGMVTFIVVVFSVCWYMKYGSWFKNRKK